MLTVKLSTSITTELILMIVLLLVIIISKHEVVGLFYCLQYSGL